MLLPARCPLCGRPGPVPCRACAATLPGPAGSAHPAVLAYDGPARTLVAALKYRNARPVARYLGDRMAGLVEAAGLGPVDVVTWPPTSPARVRRRGYDQAALLARVVARRLGVPHRQLLRRLPGTGAQTGRTRAERLRGPRFALRARPPRRVLVVDDVVTTGATLGAAAAALRAGGATTVVTLAAAATPGRDERPVSGGPQSSYTQGRRTVKGVLWTSP